MGVNVNIYYVTNSSIYMIDVHPKVWRPKPKNRYILLDYGIDIDNGVFDYARCGKTVFRPNIQWADKDRGDIIIFNEKSDMEALI